MATPAQIAANRINSQSSTGPKSEEAKQALRTRSTRHGLAGRRFQVLSFEPSGEFDDLLAALTADYAPATTQEAILVHHVAQGQWKIQRANAVESANLERELQLALRIVSGSPAPGPVDSDRALAMILTERPIEIELIRRYSTTIERSFYRSVTQLERIQKERRRQSETSHPAPPASGLPVNAPPVAENPEIGFAAQNHVKSPPPTSPAPATPPLIGTDLPKPVHVSRKDRRRRVLAERFNAKIGSST